LHYESAWNGEGKDVILPAFRLRTKEECGGFFMSRRAGVLTAVAGLFLAAGAAHAGTVGLNDWCYNFNGDFNALTGGVSCNGGTPGTAPSGWDGSLEPADNTLGSATFTLTGGQFVSFYGWYDINFESFGSFHNSAQAVGTLPGGWSYMLGDPLACNGCTFGDVFDAFAANTLNNSNSVSTPADAPAICCAVAMALSVSNLSGPFDFTFGTSTPLSPVGGFYLQQTNADTGDSLYLSITQDGGGGGGGPTVPEPSTFVAVGGAAALLAIRKWRANSAA